MSRGPARNNPARWTGHLWTGSRLLMVLAFLAPLAGCGPAWQLVPDYATRRPATVVVLPPEALAPTPELVALLYPILYEELSRRGYYAVSPELVMGVLHPPGAREEQEGAGYDVVEVATRFGADAVLRVEVTTWGGGFVILSPTARLGLRLSLLDGRSGEVLWGAEHEVERTLTRGDEGLVSGILRLTEERPVTPDEALVEQTVGDALAKLPEGPHAGRW